MSGSLPDPEQLRAFVEAFQALELDPSSPAHAMPAILALEAGLGVDLFSRSAGRAAPTRHGRALLPAAQSAVLALQGCQRAVSEAGLEGQPLAVTLGTRHELGLSWVLPQLPRLRGRFPHVTIHLYFGSGPDLEHQVRASRIDCAVTSRPFADPALTAAQLHREEYVFVASAGLAADRPLVLPSDVRRHTLIDINHDLPLFGYLSPVLEGITGASFRSLLTVGTIAAARQLILQGEGVGVLPEYLVRPDLRERRAVLLFPHVKPHDDHFRLVHRVDHPNAVFFGQLAKAMRDFPLQ